MRKSSKGCEEIVRIAFEERNLEALPAFYRDSIKLMLRDGKTEEEIKEMFLGKGHKTK